VICGYRANSMVWQTNPRTGNAEAWVHAGKPTHFSKIGKYPRARRNGNGNGCRPR
ncbi:unnamed protein product, partial [marine sediment metagenome]